MPNGLVIPNIQSVAPAPKTIFSYFKPALEEIVNGDQSYSIDDVVVFPIGFAWANEFRVFEGGKYKQKTTEPYAVMYMLAIIREKRSHKEHLISLKVDKSKVTPLEIWSQIMLSTGKEGVLRPLKKAPAVYLNALITKGIMLKYYGVEISRNTLMVDEEEAKNPTMPLMSPLGFQQIAYKENMSIGKGGTIETSSLAMRFPEGTPSKSTVAKVLEAGATETVEFVRRTVADIDPDKYIDATIRNELDIESHLIKWAQSMASQRDYMNEMKLTKPDTQFNLGGVVFFTPVNHLIASLTPKEFYDMAIVSESSENVD